MTATTKRNPSHPRTPQTHLELAHELVGEWIQARMDWMFDNSIDHAQAAEDLLMASEFLKDGNYREAMICYNHAEFSVMN